MPGSWTAAGYGYPVDAVSPTTCASPVTTTTTWSSKESWYRGRYAGTIASLSEAHRGQTSFFYLDASLDETLRRHQMRPRATQFSAERDARLVHPRAISLAVRASASCRRQPQSRRPWRSSRLRPT
jgi:hypothetical protein